MVASSTVKRMANRSKVYGGSVNDVMRFELNKKAIRELERQLTQRVVVPLDVPEPDAKRAVIRQYERQAGVRLTDAAAAEVVGKARQAAELRVDDADNNAASHNGENFFSIPAGEQVTLAIDRMWAVRDAVLRWLYISAAQANRHPTLDLEAIQEVSGWTADPLEPDEVDAATNYLKEEGYIDGQGAWGRGIFRPVITSSGERKAEEGTSVRPGPPRPANPTGHTYNTVNNYGTGNFNVGGQVDSQQLWAEVNVEPIVKVADALDQFAELEPEAGDRAHELADELRAEVEKEQPATNKLKALLGSAIGAVAVAAGSEIGQQVTQLAVSALQSLG
jgi:hypothetical protein